MRRSGVRRGKNKSRGRRARLVVVALVAAALAGWTGRASPEHAEAAADPVVFAVGDIACDPSNTNFNNGLGTSGSCRQKYTSDLIVGSGAAAVLALGDNQYYCGGYQAFLQSYDLSWGRLKPITKPAVGNHEYLTSGGTDCNTANAGAAGHFRYFGAAAGEPTKGYYSYDIGAWHIIVLNSTCSGAGGCSSGSPQGQWLRADLAAHTNFCTMAYWHVPLFSSGGRADATYRTFWDALYAAGADLVLGGHDHTYERFAPQRPDGTVDTARGLREFVVGSGGSNHTSFTTIFPNSEARNDATYGVLKLTLHATSYDWQFVPEAGASYTDSGTTQCHGVVGDTTPPTAPSDLTATAPAPNRVELSWTASTDNIGIAGYHVSRDGTVLATVTGTSFTDDGVAPNSTHAYVVTALDAGGNTSPPSNTATITTPADTSPPTAPAGLSAVAPNGYQVDLAWSASTDDVAVQDYQVWRDGTLIATVAGTSYQDATVDAETAYSYSVVARDVALNPSPPSDPASVTTPAAPTTLTIVPSDDAYVQSDVATTNFGNANQIVVDSSPVRRTFIKVTVTGVRGRTVSSAKLRLANVDGSSRGGDVHRVANTSWSEATVNWNNQPAADSATIASLGTVSAGNTYEVELKSLITGDGTYSLRLDSPSSDGAYYHSTEGAVPPQLVITTAGPPDTAAPSAPDNLTATPASSSRVDLAWTASTDNVGVTGYQVLRDGAVVGTSATTSFADTTVVSQTTYSYTVVAVDAAGNVSPPSLPATATTPAGPSILTFAPMADVTVQSDAPGTNFGSSTQIVADSSPLRRGLLKFTVTGTGGKPIQSAVLRLSCVDGSPIGGAFHIVGDSTWGEGTVTWATQPAAEPGVLASLGKVNAGVTYSVDVTALITGDGTYSIGFDSSSSNGAYYSTKEGAAPPQLVVTTAP